MRQDVIAATTLDWKLLLTVGVLVALVLVLVYRLMRRDPNVRRARYGFFVERDRFDDDEPIDLWGSPENTVELPPPKEEH